LEKLEKELEENKKINPKPNGLGFLLTTIYLYAFVCVFSV
jgi:hypothetical protein